MTSSCTKKKVYPNSIQFTSSILLGDKHWKPDLQRSQIASTKLPAHGNRLHSVVGDLSNDNRHTSGGDHPVCTRVFVCYRFPPWRIWESRVTTSATWNLKLWDWSGRCGRRQTDHRNRRICHPRARNYRARPAHNNTNAIFFYWRPTISCILVETPDILYIH